jgi:hypothetical protein
MSVKQLHHEIFVDGRGGSPGFAAGGKTEGAHKQQHFRFMSKHIY